MANLTYTDPDQMPTRIDMVEYHAKRLKEIEKLIAQHEGDALMLEYLYIQHEDVTDDLREATEAREADEMLQNWADND